MAGTRFACGDGTNSNSGQRNQMKAKNVSVSVCDFGNELFVTVTMKLTGELRREVASPDSPNGDASKLGTRVSESSRKLRSKEIRKVLEAVEFPDA
jgi:hypothetical protein